MQRGSVWDDAVALTREAIATTEADGSLAIMTIGQTPRTLVSFSDWENTDPARRVETARQAVAELSPGWSGSDLGTGMIAAAEMIADAGTDEEATRPAKIILVSDLQSGASLEALAEATWPGDLSLVLMPVDAPAADNAAIFAAASSDPNQPTVRVRNGPDSTTRAFEIRADEQIISAVVPPGESRLFQLPAPAAEVVLTGDEEGQEFDNRLFLAPREPAPLKLLFMGQDKPDDSEHPEYYFRRAFGFSEILSPRFVEDLAEKPEIVAIARPLTAKEVTGVRQLLDTGRRVLMIVTAP
jgi:hypothetical protein